ncbi:MAG: nuclear transport factor 2 family protein [Reyranella sp.]|nr:nuclear transport factor 2 family protein [Reyranella sp.]
MSRRALLAGAAVAMAGGARAQPSDDPAQLLALMERYAAGLRWGTVDALVALYTPDGVYSRDDLPAVSGTEALRAAYRQVFATLKVDLTFEIKETEVAGDMAWLRSTSKGRIKTLASGVETTETFNSLVIFRRTAAGWKIRCFMYNASKGTGIPQ